MRKINRLPSLHRLNEIISYDPVTGTFRWRVTLSNRAKAGAIAGSLDVGGYIVIRVDGKLYPAHRIAWFMMTGAEPESLVDHENTIRSDNRWRNLRLATHTENMCNSKVRAHNRCGIKGVRQLKSGRWNARIRLDRQEIGLGTFDSPEEAHAAYVRAAEGLHGEFARVA